MDTGEGKRISMDQREMMLYFMLKHPSLATGKFTAHDGAKHKQRLLEELAAVLNCNPTGISKTADKWLRSSQDWRSDVKAKSALLKREMNKTGAGQVSMKAKLLTPLEERVLGFLGLVTGHEEVLDILEGEGVANNMNDVRNQVEVGNLGTISVPVGNGLDYVILPLHDPIPDMSDELHFTPSTSPTDIYSLSAKSTSLSAKQRRRHKTNTLSDEDCRIEEEELLKVSKQQVANDTLKLEIMRDNLGVSKQKLDLHRQQTQAIESTSLSFCAAMKAMENYFNRKINEE